MWIFWEVERRYYEQELFPGPMPENFPIEKKFTQKFTNLISACRRFWLCLLSSLVCFGLWWPRHSSMDKHYRERIYHILLGATRTHKTPTFSRGLISASEFIRVTMNMWACLRSTILISKFVFRSALLSNLFPSKLWSDLYHSGPCVFAVSAISG